MSDVFFFFFPPNRSNELTKGEGILLKVCSFHPFLFFFFLF